MLTKTSAHGRQTEAGPGQQIGREMARWWLAQANSNAGARTGTTSAQQAEIKRLKAEINRLREDNEILKGATVLFAKELDPSNR
jgi:transposase-like protein